MMHRYKCLPPLAAYVALGPLGPRPSATAVHRAPASAALCYADALCCVSALCRLLPGCGLSHVASSHPTLGLSSVTDPTVWLGLSVYFSDPSLVSKLFAGSHLIHHCIPGLQLTAWHE